MESAMGAAASLRAAHFYPLVGSLFKAIGVPAVVSNQGDTSNRIDLILTHPSDPIPVEVKSRTEVEAVNVKAIQQALENKLALARMSGHTTLSASSSLVVGFANPPARSGIRELLDDIESAYGIRIGIISLRRLYEILISVNITGQAFDRDILTSLKGTL
ncbi:restriction endonuclease [Ornithinimicrobium flavum]|uniref:restriction endonuclease n=1 Tax=Ornithinimicrobium flavum TaxID=1288636 RepID=UPI00106F94CB|nr:restriction endonuclease [Ornithinimicrobium flavum]